MVFSAMHTICEEPELDAQISTQNIVFNVFLLNTNCKPPYSFTNIEYEINIICHSL